MEKIIKKVETEVVVYKCSCGKEYRVEFAAKRCERQHSCKHEKYYTLIEDDMSGIAYRGLRCTCKECFLVIGEIEFDVYYEGGQEILEKVYNLLKL